MRKQHLLTLSCLMLLPIMVFSQTKMIAHKSHSGTASTFNLDSKDNLGLGPSPEEMRKRRSIVDSIVQTPDKSLILFYRDTSSGYLGKWEPVHFNDTIPYDAQYHDTVTFYKNRYPNAKFIVLKNSSTKKQEITPLLVTPQEPGDGSRLMLPVVFLSVFMLLLFTIIVRTNKEILGRLSTGTN